MSPSVPSLPTGSMAPTSPPIIIRDYRGAQRAHEVELVRDGEVLGKFVYSPNDPLSCGARLWLECDSSKLELRPV